MRSIRFLGGAGTVTGSKYLVDTGSTRILVDCGLFQGIKELRLQNWAPFSVAPESIHEVILTHAHLDHAGYLPLLVRNGFRGHVHCSEPTRDLAQVILLDGARIQEEDASYANEKGFSKHHPAAPLYTEADSRAVFQRWQVHGESEWRTVSQDVRFRFTRSGHILGSCFVELDVQGTRIVFSGDLGRQAPLLLDPPRTIEEADILLIESTYGDRLHRVNPTVEDELARIINEVHQRRGHLIIPSFAVGRAQDLMYLLSLLKRKNRIPSLPVFLDSPMAIDATEILLKHSSWHKLNKSEIDELCKAVQPIRGRLESQAVSRLEDPSIVIAGGGMLSGGRVLHHLKARITHPDNTVLLTGFQAAGTRGRLLADGSGELKIHGEYFPVRARTEILHHLSAHADQKEILAWLRGFNHPPKHTFITHGEPQAADALRVRVRDELGWQTHIPKQNEEIVF